jgi:hypothetical protein
VARVKYLAVVASIRSSAVTGKVWSSVHLCGETLSTVFTEFRVQTEVDVGLTVRAGEERKAGAVGSARASCGAGSIVGTGIRRAEVQ